VDVENCSTIEDSRQIQLPSLGINTDRTVPGVCTICLCPYEDGDQISWSPEAACQHAFHTDCVIPWLAKKEEPQCPICRQEFCPTPIVSIQDDTAFSIEVERENSFLQSFSQVLAMSQLYRPYPADAPPNFDRARNALTLQLATLALENQVRLEQQQSTTNTSAIPVLHDYGENHTTTNTTTESNTAHPRRFSRRMTGGNTNDTVNVSTVTATTGTTLENTTSASTTTNNAVTDTNNNTNLSSSSSSSGVAPAP
jgi:Ring finger domain